MIRTLEQTWEHTFDKFFNNIKGDHVNKKSAFKTVLFLKELPKNIQGPSIFLGENGDIDMVWSTSIAYRVKNKKPALHFSLNVGREGKTLAIIGLAYGKHAKLLNTTHDLSNGIPKEVIDLLQEITDLNLKY